MAATIFGLGDLELRMHVRLPCGCEGFAHAIHNNETKAVLLLFTKHCQKTVRHEAKKHRDMCEKGVHSGPAPKSLEAAYKTTGTPWMIQFVGKNTEKIFPMEEVPIPDWWFKVARVTPEIIALERTDK